MNLKEFRRQHIEEQFVDLLLRHNFDSVCPDQDYLNILCRHAKVMMPIGWNKMPLPDHNFDTQRLNSATIIHLKAWRHDGVLFGDVFWDRAEKTEFYDELKAMKDRFSKQDAAAEAKAVASLVSNAVRISREEPVTFKRILNL
jgi:lipopolysaccharide biosynthesis glycosyltransferase